MKTLIVFDLDGTLTKSKSPIDAVMASHLTRLLTVIKVAIISGAGWPQFETQLLAHLSQDEGWSRLSLLPTSGGQFYQFDGQWRQLYSEDFSVSEKVKIIDALNLALDKSGFRETKPWGAIIEDRGGQITLSALGQAAPLNAKSVWDPDLVKRTSIKQILTPLLPEFSTSIGGATSIDITKSGIDKAYGVERLATISGVPIKDMLFVGDSLFPGGNDTPARRTGITCIQVCGPDETECVIETVIACAGP